MGEDEILRDAWGDPKEDAEYEEWVEENRELIEFLHRKVSDYVDVDFEDFARFLWRRRHKLK